MEMLQGENLLSPAFTALWAKVNIYTTRENMTRRNCFVKSKAAHSQQVEVSLKKLNCFQL